MASHLKPDPRARPCSTDPTVPTDGISSAAYTSPCLDYAHRLQRHLQKKIPTFGGTRTDQDEATLPKHRMDPPPPGRI